MRLLVLTLLLSSCSWFERHEEKPTIGPVERTRAIKAQMCASIDDPYALVDKCDASTFVGMFDAFCRHVDIYAHEYPEGRWHRNPEVCYPDESRSEISFESMLGNLLALWKRGDTAAIERAIKSANSHGWKLGEGPNEYTRLLQLAPLMYRMAGYENGGDAIADPLANIREYKANVVMYYLYVKGSVYGYLNGAEVKMAEKLVEKHPETPLFHAILHRFSDGDQTQAVEIIESGMCGAGSHGRDDRWHWGDAPTEILCAFTAGVILGE